MLGYLESSRMYSANGMPFPSAAGGEDGSISGMGCEIFREWPTVGMGPGPEMLRRFRAAARAVAGLMVACWL